jgi:hypothetical protein
MTAFIYFFYQIIPEIHIPPAKLVVCGGAPQRGAWWKKKPPPI